MNLTEPTACGNRAQLSQARVYEIFKRHPGSISTLADELGVTITMVSRWLRGQSDSKRVGAAAQKRAQELLKREAA